MAVALKYVVLVLCQIVFILVSDLESKSVESNVTVYNIFHGKSSNETTSDNAERDIVASIGNKNVCQNYLCITII
jgi:hypothetical protein